MGLAINIVSMQEMDPPVIAEYFRILRGNRAPRTAFYCCNKLWKRLADGSEVRFQAYPWSPTDDNSARPALRLEPVDLFQDPAVLALPQGRAPGHLASAGLAGQGSAMIGAVVFDLDGTLIYSAPDVAAALNRLLAEERRPALSLAQVQTLVGEGAAALIDRAWRATGDAAPPAGIGALVERYLGHYRAHPADATKVFPFVREELARLKGGGRPPRTLYQQAARHDVAGAGGAGDAAAVRCGGRRRLPPPQARWRACARTLRRMGAAGVSAVYVGDSATDVAAARDAGLPVVCVAFGYARMDPAALGADRLIAGFDELPAALAEVAP